MKNGNDQYNLKAISFACVIALIQFSVLIILAFVETIVIVKLLKILASYIVALIMITRIKGCFAAQMRGATAQ